MPYINITKDNIKDEHICCAFSDKKCAESYALKKAWLAEQFASGYVFKRLNERAKVFIEYGPAEKAWAPVIAPDYMMIGCFWVSGKYKNSGHGKALLNETVQAAERLNKKGLVTVAGTKKYHFMSDAKWLLKNGFKIRETTPAGFSLLSHDFDQSGGKPVFNDSVKSGICPEKHGLAVYYSNRCPYSEYHVKESLAKTAAKRNIPLKIIKLETMQQAQACPSPAVIFSLFFNGEFVTTDISACMDSRFDRIVKYE